MYYVCLIVYVDIMNRRMVVMRIDYGGVVRGWKVKVEKILSYCMRRC